jgi:hypothetical protein
VQWQAATTIGSASASARSDPQQQYAVLFIGFPPIGC